MADIRAAEVLAGFMNDCGMLGTSFALNLSTFGTPLPGDPVMDGHHDPEKTAVRVLWHYLLVLINDYVYIIRADGWVGVESLWRFHTAKNLKNRWIWFQ